MVEQDRMTGLIIKSLAGQYTVISDDVLAGRPVICTPRGVFRRQGVFPMVGDKVSFSAGSEGAGVLEALFPRKNSLVRPPLANLDLLVQVVSAEAPAPNTLVIDKVAAITEMAGIQPVIVINKTDLAESETLATVYRNAGFPVVLTSCAEGDPAALLETITGKISAFVGNSGVGKSSLLNLILPTQTLSTGEISKKLGRGRHTTRHVELFPLSGGGYVADTPGFSMVDIARYGLLDKRRLPEGFREFAPYIGECQFVSCSHTVEQGCAVLAALADGKIGQSRHDSYRRMYDEIKDIPEWQNTKR